MHLGGIGREGKARMARLTLSFKIFDSSGLPADTRAPEYQYASLEAQLSRQGLAGRHDHGVLPGLPFAWI